VLAPPVAERKIPRVVPNTTFELTAGNVKDVKILTDADGQSAEDAIGKFDVWSTHELAAPAVVLA
jgi:hypothetical protein